MRNYILPFRDLVVHPGLTVPIYVDNPASVSCVEAAAQQNQQLVIAAQHSWSYPSSPDDIYDVGTIGDIVQVLRMPDGALHAIVRTTSVVRLADIGIENGLFMANTTPIEIVDDSAMEQTIALRDKVAENMQALSMSKKFKLDKLRAIIQNYPMPALTLESDMLKHTGEWRRRL